MISDAPRLGHSEIHVEARETALTVRIRARGVLADSLRLPPEVSGPVLRRLKTMTGLDPEGRGPQVGRLAVAAGRQVSSLRVSTLPIVGGERVTLAIGSAAPRTADLEAAGLPRDLAQRIEDALEQRRGLLLIAGPSGSGKTATFQRALRLLNDGARDILTVEQAASGAIEGIGRTKVGPGASLTPEAALRAVIGHGPDVVGIDAPTDRETAKLAVEIGRNDALVVSTIEARDAVGAIARLREMRIEPFGLAYALSVVVAQRLVRRLCADCREPIQAGRNAALLGLDPGSVVYRPRGCATCRESGYDGRVGVFEVVRIDEGLRRQIYFGGDDAVIASQAFRSAPNLASSARKRVLQGVTTIAEAVRIARTDTDLE
ncbi:MAG: Flp pilus assembly complex ATPase component TadA [Alphaproteobacteria bacterium]|nr:Flp pilus assembly complex ATPase component TadA [Alphaproteobacteria bacterium]